MRSHAHATADTTTAPMPSTPRAHGGRTTPITTITTLTRQVRLVVFA